MMQHEFLPVVHRLASRHNGMLYCGVHRLVGCEPHDTRESAIPREKRIEKWRRAWKLDPIESADPGWVDLSAQFGFAAA